MRTPPNHALRPRTALTVLAPALLAVAVLAAAHPAEGAQGMLYIDRLDIEHCEELGTCEWKLSCKVDDGKLEELIPNGIGGDGSKLDIGKRLSLARFPATVSCIVWEDDGIIGTSWKQVATGAATLPAGGDYTIDLAGEGQGIVHVLLRADSLEIGNPPPSGDPRRFLGVFRTAEQGEAVLLGMDWNTLDARRAALAKQGVQPVLLGTYKDGNKRLWNAVLRSSPEEHVAVSDLEWESFKARLEELEDKGLHLADFETYAEGKKRLFAGIFRPARDRSTLVVGQTRPNFQNQVTRLTGQGLRLVDFEVYRSGRDLLYAGVFMPGSGGHGFRTGLDWGAFDARTKESGARLADCETYQDGKKRLYDGTFRGASGQLAVEANADWPTLEARWAEHLGKGLRLVDVETLAGIGSDD